MQGSDNSTSTMSSDHKSVRLSPNTFHRSYENQANETIVENHMEYSSWTVTLPVFLFLFVFGVLGNTLILYIYQRRMKATIFGFFVQALAIVDLTTVLIVTIGFITNELVEDLDTERMCKFLVFMTHFPSLTSGFLLCIIAIQRYRQVCYPHGRQITKKLAAKLCLGVICLAFSLSLPIIFLVSSNHTLIVRNSTLIHTECDYDDEFKQNERSIIYSFLVDGEFLGITIILSCLYFNIGKTLRQRSKNAKGHIHSAVGTKVFAILTTIFIVSVLPLLIITTIFSFYKAPAVLNNVTKPLYDISCHLPFINCIVNPIIYSINSRRFRQECLSLWSCIGKRKQDECPPSEDDADTPTNATSL